MTSLFILKSVDKYKIIVYYNINELNKSEYESEEIKMIVDTKYKVLANDEVNVFITSLTENEFLKTLDAVYGNKNYNIVEIEQML